MKGFYMVLCILLLCLILFLAIIVTKCTDKTINLGEMIVKADSTMQSKLGKQVILHKDTFMITDYSIGNNTYTLDGYFTINSKLIDSLIINK